MRDRASVSRWQSVWEWHRHDSGGPSLCDAGSRATRRRRGERTRRVGAHTATYPVVNAGAAGVSAAGGDRLSPPLGFGALLAPAAYLWGLGAGDGVPFGAVRLAESRRSGCCALRGRTDPQAGLSARQGSWVAVITGAVVAGRAEPGLVCGSPFVLLGSGTSTLAVHAIASSTRNHMTC